MAEVLQESVSVRVFVLLSRKMYQILEKNVDKNK